MVKPYRMYDNKIKSICQNKSVYKRVPEMNGGEAESYEEWDE